MFLTINQLSVETLSFSRWSLQLHKKKKRGLSQGNSYVSSFSNSVDGEWNVLKVGGDLVGMMILISYELMILSL